MINVLLYILAGLACLALGVALARIWDSEWRAARRAEARTASIAAAKQRGSDRARETPTAATQVQPVIAQERWSDMPPRVGIVPAPDSVTHRETPTEVLEPIRTSEPELGPEPAVAETVEDPVDAAWAAVEELWADGGRAGPVLAQVAEPEVEAPEPSPLYEQIAATVPVTQLGAELLTAGVRDEQAPLDWGALHDVEPTPGAEEDVPQDEARVTERRRDDDPPSGGGLGDDPSDTPRLDQTEPLAVVIAYRHDWSHARERPVGPLHWGRGLMHAVDEMRARIYFAPKVWVTHIRPAAVGPLARIRAAAADWWAAVGPDRSQTWRDGELHRVMGGGISADVHAIRRHRRGGGTWAVAA